MSAMGHKQTSRDVRVTSALPPIEDIRRMRWHVRFNANSGHLAFWKAQKGTPWGSLGDFVAARPRQSGL